MPDGFADARIFASPWRGDENTAYCKSASFLLSSTLHLVKMKVEIENCGMRGGDSGNARPSVTQEETKSKNSFSLYLRMAGNSLSPEVSRISTLRVLSALERLKSRLNRSSTVAVYSAANL